MRAEFPVHRSLKAREVVALRCGPDRHADDDAAPDERAGGHRNEALGTLGSFADEDTGHRLADGIRVSRQDAEMPARRFGKVASRLDIEAGRTGP